ncbi:unnamed protein product [Ceutorhynchus assimilis]|uniref:BPTI/Kunitz inhibitor domain-containing protein n=1 Tax=Ceutorhynchus assimilis TaxID=467358 RepID=A0A9N9MGF8_9CUCU|nr:unnamed protein product [Ceutorhynchus assimilis]
MAVKLFCLLVLMAISLSLVASRPASSYTEDLPDVMCRLPEVKGHCRALIMRWRYDPSSGKCFEFGFGGCDGNGNNFSSKKACMDMCSEIR